MNDHAELYSSFFPYVILSFALFVGVTVRFVSKQIIHLRISKSYTFYRYFLKIKYEKFGL